MSYEDVRLLAMRKDPSITPFSSTYTDIRCRQLEETFPGDPMSGVWPISAARIYRGWGNVAESDWPSVTSAADWPPEEPTGLDAKAKRFRWHHYQRIRSVRECAISLGHHIPVSVGLEITSQWDNPEDGIIQMPDPEDAIVGSHQVTIYGIDILHRALLFTNSWGPDWGQHGHGVLPYDYFDRYLVESWIPHGIGLRPHYFQVSTIGPIQWGMPNILGGFGNQVHGREVYDGANDERMGWAFVVQRGTNLDIEELFVRPQFRRQGVGRQLVEMVLEMKRESGLPLRLWVSFSDWLGNEGAVTEIARMLELELRDSPFRWAIKLGLSSAAWQSAEAPTSKSTFVKPGYCPRKPSTNNPFANRDSR